MSNPLEEEVEEDAHVRKVCPQCPNGGVVKSKQIHCEHCRHALRQLNLDPEDTKLCKEDIVKAKILQATNTTAEEEQELKRAKRARKIKVAKAKIQEEKRKRVEGILNEFKRKAASDAMMPKRRRRTRRAGETNQLTNEAEKRRTREKEEDSSSSMVNGFHGKEKEEEEEDEELRLKSLIKKKRIEMTRG